MPGSRHLSPLQWGFIISLSIHGLLLWQIWPAQHKDLAAGNNMHITLLRSARALQPQPDKTSADTAAAQALRPQDIITRKGKAPHKQTNKQQTNNSLTDNNTQAATHVSQASEQPDIQTEQQQSADNMPADTPLPVHVPASHNLPEYAQQVLMHIINKASAAPREGKVTVQIKLMRIGFATHVQIASSSGDAQLDRWVIQQILAANPFPAFAADDKDTEKTLLIPIQFQWAH